MKLRWKNLKVGTKIGVGFAVVVLLLATTSVVSRVGVNRIMGNARDVVFGNQLDRLLLQREIDHLKWAQKVSVFLTDPGRTTLEVQTDDHLCDFGKWLYGDGRKGVEGRVAELASLFKEIEVPHHQLHASIKEMQEDVRQASDLAVGKQKANRVYNEKTLLALAQVQGLLQKLSEEAKTRIITDEQMVATASEARSTVTILGVAGLVVAVVFGFFITRSLTRPIHRAVGFAKAMANGDLTQTLQTDHQDEVGTLMVALDQMGKNLCQMFKEMTGGVEVLASSSTELSTIAEQMATGSKQSSERATTVATGAEEMSANVRTVAAAIEQSATSVNTVTTASEQMTGAIQEIAQNTERATAITQEAVTQARSASEKINQLGTAAQEIGKVTQTITEISEQTNLLALNATIEAARAGDAGKGFAVVANEIKELANQTAQATEEIRDKISGIQDSTHQSVGEIGKITKVIAEVNDIVATIASAVEEQSVTTREIAQSITQASQGIQQVSKNVAQTSTVAGNIAKDVADVNRISGEVSQGSRQIQDSSTELSKLSEQLQQMVRRFKV